MATYSISVRLRRTTVEERYVSVPVTDAMMRTQPDDDGAYHLDGEKVLAAAVELGQDDTGWLPEDRQITVHPIQRNPADA